MPIKQINGGYEAWTEDEKIDGPFKTANEALAAYNQHVEDSKKPVEGLVDPQVYLKKLNEQLANEHRESIEKVRKIIFKDYGEDAANVIMRQIEPILRTGGRGQRRESMRFAKAS